MNTFRYQNKKIFYRKEGKGKPLILVHGFGENGNIWNEQVDVLKENNLLIIPDLPGSGNSEMLDGTAFIKDYAEVIRALADEAIFQDKEINDEQFSLIGHSMGGYTTVAYAQKYPESLSSFGLFHSSAFADSEEKKQTRKKGIDFIKSHGSIAFLKTIAPNLFSPKTQKDRPELINQLVDLGKNITPEALIQYYEAMMARPDRSLVLESFSRPVLLIAGKYDTAIPLDALLQQFKMPSIASVHILQQSGHMGMWEETDLSNSILKNFLIQLN
ncbi:alpha/beta hydrolase [Hanamia caeni]|uniref:Alpha/beta hydrolase n=1 Tax=Hanamia caeni TaxID=2294116 RepID=A0A3M9NJK8_9BACT|nr:alpha/beta hydrolase [Hanamia caeni]RNI37986.1 alpha/beta hydrolase [Hanamia caeni]